MSGHGTIGARAPGPFMKHLVPISAEGIPCSSSGALCDGMIYIGMVFQRDNGPSTLFKRRAGASLYAAQVLFLESPARYPDTPKKSSRGRGRKSESLFVIMREQNIRMRWGTNLPITRYRI